MGVEVGSIGGFGVLSRWIECVGFSKSELVVEFDAAGEKIDKGDMLLGGHLSHGIRIGLKFTANFAVIEDAPGEGGHEDGFGTNGAGFFDDPVGDEQRTVGAYARVDALTDDLAQALIGHVGELSGRFEVRIEIQFDEAILGHLVAGVPDGALMAALSAR